MAGSGVPNPKSHRGSEERRMTPGLGGGAGRILCDLHIHIALCHPQGSSSLLWIGQNLQGDHQVSATPSFSVLALGHPSVSGSPNRVAPFGRESQLREHDLHGTAGPKAGPLARPSLKLGTRVRNVSPSPQADPSGGPVRQGLPCCK